VEYSHVIPQGKLEAGKNLKTLFVIGYSLLVAGCWLKDLCPARNEKGSSEAFGSEFVGAGLKPARTIEFSSVGARGARP